MGDLKKRQFTLELTDEDAKAFIEKCMRDGTTPAEVLEGFINDLVDGTRTRGSDERRLASEYYERCGYIYFQDEDHTFLQWLMNDFTFETVAGALDDMITLKEEVKHLQTHPDEIDKPGEIEELESVITACAEEINKYYEEYEKSTTKPQPQEEAIADIYKYSKELEKIMKGGKV